MWLYSDLRVIGSFVTLRMLQKNISILKYFPSESGSILKYFPSESGISHFQEKSFTFDENCFVNP